MITTVSRVYHEHPLRNTFPSITLSAFALAWVGVWTWATGSGGGVVLVGIAMGNAALAFWDRLSVKKLAHYRQRTYKEPVNFVPYVPGYFWGRKTSLGMLYVAFVMNLLAILCAPFKGAGQFASELCVIASILCVFVSFDATVVRTEFVRLGEQLLR